MAVQLRARTDVKFGHASGIEHGVNLQKLQRGVPICAEEWCWHAEDTEGGV